MVNLFQGLHTGPIDHRATSVINAISNSEIDMGGLVIFSVIGTGEILPRVFESISEARGSSRVYGIAVGGDEDGIYGNGGRSTDDSTRATTGAGQAVKVVTQGRCPALIKGFTGSGTATQINIGDPLTHDAGRLQLAETGNFVIARALDTVSQGAIDIIAVDVKREGPL